MARRALARCRTVKGVFCLAATLAGGSFAGCATALSLDEAIEKAVAASYDLKLAAMDVSISRQDVRRTAFNEYLPAASLRVNTEYARDLTQAGVPSVRSVGDAISVNNTLYQNSMTLQLTYNLFDFGVRRHKLRYLNEDVNAKRAAAQTTLKELKEKVVDAYSQALLADTDRRVQRMTASSQQEVAVMKQRLFQAGLIPRTELADEAVRLAENLAQTQAAEDRYDQALGKLSELTREPYSGKGTTLDPLQARVSIDDFVNVDFTQTPQTRQIDRQIAQKQEELKVLNRQLLPTLTAYGNYRLYGSDERRALATLHKTEPFAASVGVATTIALFDAGRQVAGRKKIHLELARLNLEREKSLAEQRNRWIAAMKEQQAAERAANQADEVLRQRQEKLTMLNRLADERMLDQTLLIKANMQALQDRRERERADIQRLSLLETLRVMTEAAP